MMQLTTQIDRLVALALAEDIGTGDITTELTIAADSISSGYFLAKQDLVLACRDIVDAVFAQIDPNVTVTWSARDGDRIEKFTKFGTIHGASRALLTGERTALNFLQRLCGVATYTRQMVDRIADTGAQLVDTRKTTPGWRLLEKRAVRHGGGRNHRLGLNSGIMIKDNHIKAAGSIAAAVARVRDHAPHVLRIEVEARTETEITEALAANVDIILLDNMTPAQLQAAVLRIGDKALTEASGGIDRRTVRDVALTGVDFISVGALTHSAPAVDISMKFL